MVIKTASKLSSVFTTVGEHHNLTTVHRASGAIVEVANQVRTSGLTRPLFTATVEDEHSCLKVHPARRSWLKEALNLAASLENHQSDQFRLLTYTRKAAAAFGQKVHAKRYGFDAPRFVEGQRLVTLSTIADPDNPNGFNIANSTVEFDVVKAAQVERRIPFDDQTWLVWTIIGRSAVDGSTFTCHVLDDSEQKRYAVRHQELLQLGKDKGGSAWRPFYSLQDQFADIGYWWAVTVHRSQGRQYEQVWVDLQDIDENTKRDRDTRRRLIYVGLTRAEKTAHVIADKEVG